jgi:hypothetical protein
MSRTNRVILRMASMFFSKVPHRKRSLENRTVLCVDCDCNRTLSVSSYGRLICSACGSEHWMFVSAPIIANFKEYDERAARERAAVDRYIAQLEREEFFTSQDALV